MINNVIVAQAIAVLASGIESKITDSIATEIIKLTNEESTTKSSWVQTRDAIEIIALGAALTSLTNAYSKLTAAMTPVSPTTGG